MPRHFTQDEFELFKRRERCLLHCIKRRKEGTKFQIEERERRLEILETLTLYQFNLSQARGLENIIREDYIIYDFHFSTRAEQEARIKYLMRGRKRDECLKLLRSSYK